MAQNSLDLKLYHYPSGTAVTELKVAQDSTVGLLRAKIEEKLVSDDCPMVVFSKWFRLVKVGEEKRHVGLANADTVKSLVDVGIEDRSELFLEGPLVPLGAHTPAERLQLGHNHRFAKHLETLNDQLEGLKLLMHVKEEPSRCGGGSISTVMFMSTLMFVSIGVLIFLLFSNQVTSLQDPMARMEERLIMVSLFEELRTLNNTQKFGELEKMAEVLSEVRSLNELQQEQMKVAASQKQKLDSLLNEVLAMKEIQAKQQSSLREAARMESVTLNQKFDELLKHVEILRITQGLQQQQLSTTQTKQSEALTALLRIMAFEPLGLDQANALLVKYSGLPLKALWEVLNDKESSVVLAMAIVMDIRCGLERRSTLAEGEMKDKRGWVFNVEKGGLTPLIMATLAGRVDVMIALLAAGADVNVQDDKYRLTSLGVAANTNNPRAIELLVSYEADVNPGGSTPLHEAAFWCNLEAIEMLITKQADIMKLNKNRETPLNTFEKREKEITWKSQEVKDRIRKLLTPR